MAFKFKSSHNNVTICDQSSRKTNGIKHVIGHIYDGQKAHIKLHSNDLKKGSRKLPVSEYKSQFFKLLDESQSVLVIGETGCGKTTQIPQWCVEYCRQKLYGSHVACTQPRRIAAMSVAARVAEERGTELGKEVGYEVRFEANCTSSTRLTYLTDGMLLREATFKKNLPRYGIIILDEAHERTLQTEILFGIIKRALKNRNGDIQKSGDDSADLKKPLKVVIMSATINAKMFKRYFSAPLLHIEGRQYPVHNMTTEVSPPDLLMATITCVFQVHRNCEDGDILVFCSGQDEITTLVILTKRTLKYAATQPQTDKSLLNLIPLPLYASLPAAQQMQVFNRNCHQVPRNSRSLSNGKGKSNVDEDLDDSDDSNGATIKLPSFHKTYRRVIYATNVAETSVTIPNIKYVIDTGKVKCRTYCPKTGLESLKVTNISKAQAIQRSGRAGRVAAGTCYRLYTSDDYKAMPEHLDPEIKRCNLDSVLMQLIAIDSDNIREFEFLDRPEDERIKAALRNLLSLKAITPSKISGNSESTNNYQKNFKANGEVSPSSSTPTPSSSGSDPSLTSTNHNSITPALLADDNALLTLFYDLTSLGNKLRRFPLHPSLARVILAAHELGCLDEALTVVSLLSIENLFYIQPSKQSKAEQILNKFHSNEGDTIMLLNVYRAFRRIALLNKKGLKQWCLDHFIHIKNLKLARLIRKQLLQIARIQFGMQSSTCSQDTSILRRALTYGLFNNVATMWDGKYRNKVSNKEVFIHPSSCLFKIRPEYILYMEVVETNKCYMRNCTLIDINWVREVSVSASS